MKQNVCPTIWTADIELGITNMSPDQLDSAGMINAAENVAEETEECKRLRASLETLKLSKEFIAAADIEAESCITAINPEWLEKMAEAEDGKCCSVGGLAVELGLITKREPFGRELLIDLYGVSPDKCDSLEFTYRLLEKLVVFIGMTQFCPAYCLHSPQDREGKELFPGKEGVTAFIALIESSIVLHSINEKGFVSIDIYTCGCLDVEKAIEFVKKAYETEDVEYQVVERGRKYHK